MHGTSVHNSTMWSLISSLLALSPLSVSTVVNNQLSGAGKVEMDLIDFQFKPSSYLYRFKSYPVGLDT
jgi:hypothetical protein